MIAVIVIWVEADSKNWSEGSITEKRTDAASAVRAMPLEPEDVEVYVARLLELKNDELLFDATIGAITVEAAGGRCGGPSKSEANSTFGGAVL